MSSASSTAYEGCPARDPAGEQEPTARGQAGPSLGSAFSTYTRAMRVSGLIFVRTGCYVTLGLLFGMLAFARTSAHKRRTGRSPWHIHPLVWGIVSVFVTFLVTLL